MLAGPADPPHAWLARLLARNAHCAYLREHGSPRDLAAFRRMPIVTYEDLEQPWLARVAQSEADVLFAGRPCAFEQTGGSSRGPKLIPYSVEGLADFQAAVAPWLASVVAGSAITGSVYLSMSPATRAPMDVAGIPVGLPDGAYLGEEWGRWVASHSAVPLELMLEQSVDVWREKTLHALRSARDLQLVSVWSPTFFLRLLEDIPEDPQTLWPQLKVVSCWASAASGAHAQALLRLLAPGVHLQPKGLLSTECVVTVPDAQDRPVLTDHGFFEFAQGADLLLAQELRAGEEYEVIATTASGLYRYRTGDLVRCEGFTGEGRPVLGFLGRCGLASDLVGEKLVEAFVQEALNDVPGFRFLAPAESGRNYLLVTDGSTAVDAGHIDARLRRNPQYDHARRVGQLSPVSVLPLPGVYDRYVAHKVRRGARLADAKPLALVTDTSWLAAAETR